MKKFKRTHTYLCVNLKTITKNVIKVNKKQMGTLVMDEENEHFEFRQRGLFCEHPELHWRLIDRTKHGKASLNARHIKVEFYIHHNDYQSPAELADLLASEIEVLGDNICNINLEEEVSKCC